MTRQSELDGETDPIDIAAAFRHQHLVGAAAGAASRHDVSVKWLAKKSLPLTVRDAATRLKIGKTALYKALRAQDA